jgi:hypothetical protein
MNKSFAVKIVWLAAALFIAGCATHRVDWNARVGTFTYDQAVVELGPPDKQAKLTDGQTVAEWISRYNTGGSVGMGTGFYGGGAGVGFVQTTPTYRESKLRLVFGINNVLTSWSRN